MATASAQVPHILFSKRSTLKLTNSVTAVEVLGNLAYVADLGSRLSVVDIRNPDAPEILGAVATAAPARDIFLSGTHAYVAARTAGLQIFDVSNPANPTLVKTFDTPNEAWAVQVVGNIAYLANGTTGLHIIDVTDPANPVQLGRYDSPGNARDIAIKGNLAYLADEDPGIQVIDISNPTALVRRANYLTPDWAVGIQIVDNVAYVADDTGGLVVLDVQNTVPVRLGGADTDGLLSAIHVAGNLAYVTGGSPGLIAFDISNPSSPVRVGAYSALSSSSQVEVVGNLAFVGAGAAGLEILEIRSGFLQDLVTASPAGNVLAIGVPYPLEFSANSGLPLTVMVEGPVRLESNVLTVTNLGAVRLVIEQAGDARYLPYRSEREFNVPRILATELGSFPSFLSLRDVEVAGTTAWLAAGFNGLFGLDISNPRAPVLRGDLPMNGFARVVRTIGTTAYVAAESGGLVLVDTVNQTNLVRLTNVPTRGSTLDVKVANGIAYVADGSAGLALIDVSNRNHPVRLGATNHSTNVFSVSIAGDRAYLGHGIDGFSVVDVRDPANPVRLAWVPEATDVRMIEVIGDIAFVAGGSQGLLLYDVADPARIRQLGQLPLGGSANTVQVVGDLAYLCNVVHGVQVVDVSDPSLPKLLGSFDVSGGPLAMDVIGTRGHAVGWGGRLQILDIRYGSPQDVVWQLPDTQAIDIDGLPLAAATTAGLPPVFSVVSGPARIVDDTLVFSGVGRVVVRAEQGGDEAFLPVSSTFTVTAELPELHVEHIAGEVVLSWPAGLTNAHLQALESLASSNWTYPALPRTESGGEVHVRPGGTPFQFFRLRGFPDDAEPLQLTGWNRDVVLENAATNKAVAVDSFGAAWFEAGLQGYTDGLPANRTIVSKVNDVVFQLQPYTGSNVLALTIARRTNSLELIQPKAFSRLHVLAHSAGGGANGLLRIHYADGTSSTNHLINTPDWWDGAFDAGTRNPAINGLARSRTAAGFAYDFVSPGFGLHQTDIDLSSGPNAGKVIVRLEFVRNLAAEVTCIFAVSGVPMAPVP